MVSSNHVMCHAIRQNCEQRICVLVSKSWIAILRKSPFLLWGDFSYFFCKQMSVIQREFFIFYCQNTVRVFPIFLFRPALAPYFQDPKQRQPSGFVVKC